MADLLDNLTNVTGLTAAQYGAGPVWIDRVQNFSDTENLYPCTPKEMVKVATFGDSTGKISVTPTSAFDITTFTTSLVSGTVTDHLSGTKAMVDYFYPNVQYVGDGGISGNTLSQMLARDEAVASVSRKAIKDITGLTPDIIILRGGSINSVRTVTAGTYDATLASVYAEHVEVINRMLNDGIKVLDEGLFGCDDAGATDLAQTQRLIVEINSMYKALAEITKGLFFLSPVGLLSDVTGSFLTNMSDDGVHLSQTGTITLAQKEATIFTALFGPPASSGYPGVNLWNNAYLIDRTGLPNAILAVGLSTSALNQTRDLQYIEAYNGKLYQFCNYTVTGAGSNGTLKIDLTSASVDIVSGKTYGIEVDILLETLDGSALDGTMVARIDMTKTAAGRYLLAMQSGSMFVLSGGKLDMKMKFQKLTFTASSVDFSTLFMNFNHSPTNTSGQQYRIGFGGIRVVEIV